MRSRPEPAPLPCPDAPRGPARRRPRYARKLSHKPGRTGFCLCPRHGRPAGGLVKSVASVRRGAQNGSCEVDSGDGLHVLVDDNNAVSFVRQPTRGGGPSGAVEGQPDAVGVSGSPHAATSSLMVGYECPFNGEDGFGPNPARAVLESGLAPESHQGSLI